VRSQLRELDYEIAREVFRLDQAHEVWGGTPMRLDGEERTAVPHYSSDIYSAWQVVEFIERRHNHRLQLTRLGFPGALWRATFFRGELSRGHEFKAETAPEAICRAALYVVRLEG
jgi:hypothetical protein